MPRLWIKQLTFSDGSTVELGKSDIALIVGPNNAGKSATLRAVRYKLSTHLASPILSGVLIDREGDSNEVETWLESFTRKHDPNVPDPAFQGLGSGVHRSQINQYWNGQQPLQGLARFFCHLLTADERLQAANPAPNISFLHEPLSHPIHYLARDEQLEKRLSNHFKSAFGAALIVNRLAGNQVPLHVGERPVPKPGQDRLSLENRDS
jgi:ABC-type cobalamin/Fe3+-siderophores transport system ATPase subunit